MPAYRPTNKSADLPTFSQAEAARLFNVSERMIRGGCESIRLFYSSKVGNMVGNGFKGNKNGSQNLF